MSRGNTNCFLAREKRYRDDEAGAWQEILLSIKLDMCAEDIKLLGPLTTFASKSIFILSCEAFSCLEKKVNEEKNVVDSMRVNECKREIKKERKKVEMKCNWCAKKGHIEANCWSKERGEPKVDLKDSYEVKFKGFKCEKKGHMVKNCPEK